MQIVVLLRCLGNNDKKKVYMRAVQTPPSQASLDMSAAMYHFAPNISNLGWLNSWLQNSQTWRANCTLHSALNSPSG